MILKFKNPRCKRDNDCEIKGTITLSPNAYEVFRALSYEWISDRSATLSSEGINIFFIRSRTGLDETTCRDSLELLMTVGIVRQNSPDHYSVTALGTRTTLFQEEGKKYLKWWDQLADEWWEEQQQLKSKGIFRENCARKTKQCPLAEEE